MALRRCNRCNHTHETHGEQGCAYTNVGLACTCQLTYDELVGIASDAPSTPAPLDPGPRTYTIDIEVSPTAAKMVELDFNPDGREDVRRLKVLGAGLITLAENIRATSDPSGQGPRRASTGITDIEKGVMMAVKALFA